jgi:hypothetical protein
MKLRLLLAILLLVAATVAFAGDRVPFQASLAATSLTVTPPFAPGNPCPGPSAFFQITAVGQMSHLGLITDVQSHCLSVIPDASGNLPFFNGQTTLTAANGDKIFGVYDGYVETTAAGHIIHGFLTNTGGTGRFKNATGEGTALGVEITDANGMTVGVALTLKGTMDSVGAAKKN